MARRWKAAGRVASRCMKAWSVIAQIAEVGIGRWRAAGARVVAAVDCGTAVAPNQIAAQMQGAVCFGLSAACSARSRLKNGKVDQTDFDGYRLRMNEGRSRTHIVPSTNRQRNRRARNAADRPAVANALLVLTGKPTSTLPFVKALDTGRILPGVREVGVIVLDAPPSLEGFGGQAKTPRAPRKSGLFLICVHLVHLWIRIHPQMDTDEHRYMK